MTATDTEVEVAVAAADLRRHPDRIDAIRQGFAALGVRPPTRRTAPSVSPPTEGLEVNEPSPYRFDGLPGEHSFTEDLRDAT
jgi:hypothetical protein